MTGACSETATKGATEEKECPTVSEIADVHNGCSEGWLCWVLAVGM
jgi:hypothetical protein